MNRIVKAEELYKMTKEAKEKAFQKFDNEVNTYITSEIMPTLKNAAENGYFSTYIEIVKSEEFRKRIVYNLTLLGYTVQETIHNRILVKWFR